jgi:hypothetical protein
MAVQATQEQVLTPSEIVLLFGDRFVKKAMLGEKLILADMKVSTSDLAEMMMTAGILASQARGFMTLNIEKGKALFGLVKTEKLKVSRGNVTSDWPAQSFEAELLAALGNEAMELDDLVIAYIGGQSSSPQRDFIARVKGDLAARGVVTAEVKKVLGLSVGMNVLLTPAQRARIEQAGPSDVTALVANAEKSQPEILKKIKSSVSSAFVNRTEQSGPDDLSGLGRTARGTTRASCAYLRLSGFVNESPRSKVM